MPLLAEEQWVFNQHLASRSCNVCNRKDLVDDCSDHSIFRSCNAVSDHSWKDDSYKFFTGLGGFLLVVYGFMEFIWV